MFLKKLVVHNFKNYSSAELLFSEKINCFTGGNGEGKTNLLDAIHYLSFCKSFFNATDYQNILHGTDFFSIHGVCLINGKGEETISCLQKMNHRKIFKCNNKEYDRLSEHIGLFPLVMISPYDTDLINHGSEDRRKYVDSVISQFDKFYLDDLINYQKIVYQRNSLLKQAQSVNAIDKETLEIYDDQLVSLGHKIYETRKSFLIDFLPLFQQYYQLISHGKEQVNVIYESQLHDESMKVLLKAALVKDVMFQYTTVGVHKDDLSFLLGDYSIKRYGSQGQQKTFVLALKLAQFDYTKNKKGFSPILLFDDVFDKLDNERVEQLLTLVSDDHFGQVFITDTQKERVKRIFNHRQIAHKTYEIIAGSVSEEMV